jgi:hypothetical protein
MRTPSPDFHQLRGSRSDLALTPIRCMACVIDKG